MCQPTFNFTGHDKALKTIKISSEPIFLHQNLETHLDSIKLAHAKKALENTIKISSWPRFPDHNLDLLMKNQDGRPEKKLPAPPIDIFIRLPAASC